MITDSFDPITEAIVTPAALCREERRHVADVAIATFSEKILAEALNRFPHETLCHLASVNGGRDVYLIREGDFCAVIFLIHVGASPGASDVIEVNWLTGAEKFIMFGSAGSLDREATAGKYVIPTAAYRDEGMSYHYAPPADYIEIKNADFLADFFARHSFPYVKGRVWTTDAIFRETADKIAFRKEEGAKIVEMEQAGCIAVARFRHFSYGALIYGGDDLSGPEWDGRSWRSREGVRYDLVRLCAALVSEI